LWVWEEAHDNLPKALPNREATNSIWERQGGNPPRVGKALLLCYGVTWSGSTCPCMGIHFERTPIIRTTGKLCFLIPQEKSLVITRVCILYLLLWHVLWAYISHLSFIELWYVVARLEHRVKNFFEIEIATHRKNENYFVSIRAGAHPHSQSSDRRRRTEIEPR
jgi:hypothetical protein